MLVIQIQPFSSWIGCPMDNLFLIINFGTDTVKKYK